MSNSNPIKLFQRLAQIASLGDSDGKFPGASRGSALRRAVAGRSHSRPIGASLTNTPITRITNTIHRVSTSVSGPSSARAPRLRSFRRAPRVGPQ
ncbi:hypothetical protein EVAR_75222_1 [Eumeta japonica]|uniref:Uncharacterized protein n=1 Tax=Eumeta variegata TaxID=151549 RepID=A0A4C1V824_EUMVA|nr:hypothetical protein EVAR_75222_1 [Eumeta japonica]